jgi:hypothetical protein
MHCPTLAIFQNSEEVKMAVREWLRIQELEFRHEGRFKLVPRCGKYINVFGDCVEK